MFVSRHPNEAFKQELADASPLIGIHDTQRQLGHRPALFQCHVAAVAYNRLRVVAVDDRYHQSNMAPEVRLREVAQLVRGEAVFEAEESIVARVRTEPVEVTREGLLVAGANCANLHGSAVAQHRIRGVF